MPTTNPSGLTAHWPSCSSLHSSPVSADGLSIRRIATLIATSVGLESHFSHDSGTATTQSSSVMDEKDY
jgi:hypothetical protein